MIEHAIGDIWAQLKNRVGDEIKDSGMLRAVFSGVECLGFVGDGHAHVLRLGLPNSLYLGIAQNDLGGLIHQQLGLVLNTSNIRVQFEACEERSCAPLSIEETIFPLVEDEGEELRSPQIALRPQWFLNPEFKLEQFVNGEHSNFAYKCIEMFTSSSQPHLRQLFLYGASGLGKTHLLNALGWRFKKISPHLNVKIFNADEFINDYHLYLAKKQMAEFRGKYRLQTDVLLIDDVQSLARTKGAQEELFNIFNYFEQTGKFLAFTSDQTPLAMEGFEPRLLSRFQGGVSAELQIPDLSSRIKILEEKQFKYGFVLSSKIIESIASMIATNVRCLEGALFKVGSYQRMNGRAVTPEELAKLLPLGAREEPKASVESILDSVAKTAGLKKTDLKAASRKREIVVARNQAMLRMRDELAMSLADIGRVFMKDHSTVINGIKRARSL